MDRPKALTLAIRAAVCGAPENVAELATLDGSSEVLGRMLRLLLEERHPDGLDGDDIRALMADEPVRLVVLAGALGIHPSDEEIDRPDPSELTLQACLLIAQLLDRRPVDRYITTAFADMARNELMEAP